MKKRFPILPVAVDSPMAAATTAAYANRKEEQDEEYASILTQTETSAANSFDEHCFIARRIETTQRCERRARDHQRFGHDDWRSRFASRDASRSRSGNDDRLCRLSGCRHDGRRILDGEPEVKIMGQWVPVRCRIAKIGGFSAHADWAEVLRWLEGMEAACRAQTFLTHGEPEAATRWPDISRRSLAGMSTFRSTAKRSS